MFPDDGLRHEIIEGEHHVIPSPATRHQRILGNLFYLLRRHLETHQQDDETNPLLCPEAFD